MELPGQLSECVTDRVCEREGWDSMRSGELTMQV